MYFTFSHSGCNNHSLKVQTSKIFEQFQNSNQTDKRGAVRIDKRHVYLGQKVTKDWAANVIAGNALMRTAPQIK